MFNQPYTILLAQFLFHVSLTLGTSTLHAQSVAELPTSRQINPVRFEVFVRGDLPAAEQVKTYVAGLQERVAGLEIRIYDVLKDRKQLKRLHDLTKKFGKSKTVVPAFYTCNRMYFGFADEATSGPKIENLLVAEVYTRSTCQRCQAAKRFIAELKPQWPAITFRIHEITNDLSARMQWERLCRERGQVPGLPTIDFAGQVIIGYQGDPTTGAQLAQLINGAAGVRVTRSEDSNTEATPEQPPVQPSPNETDNADSSPDAHQQSAWMLSPTVINLGILFVPQQASETDELELPEAADESDIGEGVAEEISISNEEIQESIAVPWFGTLRVADLGMPAFTFAVGLIDGFNPCAMWILVFLLSVLVNIRDRRKILLIAGTFVIVSGLAYFAFMAAWLNLFMLIGIARPVQITLGVFAIFIGVVNVKDFFAFKKGISLSIPESTKPGLYRRVREIVNAKYLSVAISGAIVLAVLVNMIELLCTAGLPALYTQILTLQNLPVWQNYLYLAIYISAYMLDDTVLLLIVVATMSHRRLQENEGRWLKLLSGLVILALGLVMIVRPAWLQVGS